MVGEITLAEDIQLTTARADHQLAWRGHGVSTRQAGSHTYQVRLRLG